MEENKNTETKKTGIGTLVLMGIGFLVSGIMGAATASELPDAIKRVGSALANTGGSEEEKPSTDAPAE